MATNNNPLFFWEPEQENGYLGQWYPSNFVATESDGTKVTYQNAAHYMMHHKCLLFAPQSEITAEILLADHPRTMKALGRNIPNFDEDVWCKEQYQIVVQGNYLKFIQTEDLKAQLMATGERELVEASPLDRIWGVGFTGERAESQRSKWGLNLLGKALMMAREMIQKESDS